MFVTKHVLIVQVHVYIFEFPATLFQKVWTETSTCKWTRPGQGQYEGQGEQTEEDKT